MDQRIFVIGDIHGCNKTFRKLIFDILNINESDTIYLLGDYIDRGPDSKGVVDTILDLLNKGFNILPLMGNHEQMLLDSSLSIDDYLRWLANKGNTTLHDFGYKTTDEFEEKYVNFFKNLKYYYLVDDFLLVHGGVNFSIPNPFDDLISMVWERNAVIDKSKIGGRKMICGHTPTRLEEVKESISSDRIRLDGGCVYKGMYPSIGYLCCLELNSMKLFWTENIEDSKC
jgi:serine/threonine protein phosphatase 1